MVKKQKNMVWLTWLLAVIAVVALILAIVAINKVNMTGESIFNWKNKAKVSAQQVASTPPAIVLDLNTCESVYGNFTGGEGTNVHCDVGSVIGMIPPFVRCDNSSFRPVLIGWGSSNVNYPAGMSYNCIDDFGITMAPSFMETTCCDWVELD